MLSPWVSSWQPPNVGRKSKYSICSHKKYWKNKLLFFFSRLHELRSNYMYLYIKLKNDICKTKSRFFSKEPNVHLRIMGHLWSPFKSRIGKLTQGLQSREKNPQTLPEQVKWDFCEPYHGFFGSGFLFASTWLFSPALLFVFQPLSWPPEPPLILSLVAPLRKESNRFVEIKELLFIIYPWKIKVICARPECGSMHAKFGHIKKYTNSIAHAVLGCFPFFSFLNHKKEK